jgi:large repetitive protein
MPSVPTAPSPATPITDTGKGARHQIVRSAVPNYTPSHYAPVPVGAVLQGGTPGAAYSETISEQGGTSPYTFAVTSGALPTGTSLNSSTGNISGTPSAAASFGFTVTVTDSLGFTGSQAFTIVVSAGGGVSNYGFVA